MRVAGNIGPMWCLRIARSFFLQVLWCLLPGLGFAQHYSHGSPENRVDSLLSSAQEALSGDSARVFDDVNAAIELAREQGLHSSYIDAITDKSYFLTLYGKADLGMHLLIDLLRSHELENRADSLMVFDSFAWILRELGATSLALDHRKMLKPMFGQGEPSVEGYHNQEHMAILYSDLGYTDSSIHAYEDALKFAMALKSRYHIGHCYHNLGSVYMGLKDYDQAFSTFSRGIEQLDSFQFNARADSGLYRHLGSFLFSNRGICHYEKGNLAEAEADFAYVLSEFREGLVFSIHSKCLLYLGQINVHQQNFDAAETYFAEAMQLVEGHAPSDELNVLEKVSAYYESIGDTLRLLELSQKMNALLQVSLEDARHESPIESLVKFRIEDLSNDLKTQKILLQQNEDISTLRIWLIVLASVMTISIMLFVFLRRIQRQKVQRSLAELDKKHLTEKLKFKSKDATDFAMEISRVQQLLNETLSKLKSIKRSKEANRVEQVNELIVGLQSSMIIDNNLKSVYEKIELANTEFVDAVSRKFPELTKNELQICCLLRLQLSSKEIAVLRGISPDSVKVLRHRIRKKMELDSKQSLTAYLATFEEAKM